MNAISTSRERRRAIVAPFVATMLIVLVGAVALSVDVGYMVVANGEMQNAVDASALAGASGLPESNGTANSRALHYAANNSVAGVRLGENEATVIIGNWEGYTQTFFPLTGAEVRDPNAVRVVGARPNFQLFFARALGMHSTNIDQDAVASAGSGTCAGIWGLDGVSGNGDLIADSYDPDKGLYGPGNSRANADVCSNRDIVLGGGVEIYGDTMYGEDYSVTLNGSSHEIWGMVDDHDGEIIPPPFDMAAAATVNDNATIGLTSRGVDPFRPNSWDLKLVADDTLTLNGGTYYFDSVAMGAQSVLFVAGPTVIYVAGDANFGGGGIVNVGQTTADLTIYSTGSTMTLGGNAGFWGAVIAPQTEVKLAGTGDYYGTVMAGDLKIVGDTVFHVDEQLVFELFNLDPVVPILVE